MPSLPMIRNLGFTVVLYLGVYTFVAVILFVVSLLMIAEGVIPQVLDPYVLSALVVAVCGILWMIMVVLWAIPEISARLRGNPLDNPWKCPELLMQLWRTNIVYVIGWQIIGRNAIRQT